MREITPNESFEFYIDTLSYLDEKNLLNSDEELQKIILEELDSDSHTFLNHFTVNRLVENDLIPQNVAKESIELRKQIRILIDTKFSIDEIRNNKDWIKVREIAKNILKDIEK
ncbi:hypothetical protein [Flavobacterium aquiphilum]|uniref:hypothetical protein n=1 Tax=Flavobacterium aquiphilum TaxID=3003261 RepID=UPI0024818BB0|nr:hypothetical protein [Flavobacterium aquiphilum]